ncbi:DUF4878 domain-containing protein [Ferruginibacter sp.]
MKKIFILTSVIVLLFGCSGTPGSPKATVISFIEAMKKGDMETIKKLITKSDASMLSMAESMGQLFGQDKNMQDKMKNEFIEKSKKVSFNIKDEKVEGDNAEVNVEITDGNKTTTQPFKLLKEDGSWKVSLISTGLNMANNNDDMNNTNINVADSINKAMGELKNLNTDTLQKIMNENQDKVKEIMKKNPDAMKKLEEALKKNSQ